jgi:hypothetical protein
MDEESTVTTPTFASLGLSDPLLRVLSEVGYEAPTPIQAKTIPALLQGRDLIGQAQTGTGKTAAFALPMLQQLDPNLLGVQALAASRSTASSSGSSAGSTWSWAPRGGSWTTCGAAPCASTRCAWSPSTKPTRC